MLKNSFKRILACVVVCVLTTNSMSVYAAHSHTYKQEGLQQTEHPHKYTMKCTGCGDSYDMYPLMSGCMECTFGVKRVTETATDKFTFFYGDEDQGIGVPILATVDCSVEYFNLYSFPEDIYNYPDFASFDSRVTTYADVPVIYPDVVCIPLREVDYYRSNTLLTTQQLKFEGGSTTTAIPSPTSTLAFPIPYTKPTRAIAQGGFAMSGAIGTYDLTVQVDF